MSRSEATRKFSRAKLQRQIKGVWFHRRLADVTCAASHIERLYERQIRRIPLPERMSEQRAEISDPG